MRFDSHVFSQHGRGPLSPMASCLNFTTASRTAGTGSLNQGFVPLELTVSKHCLGIEDASKGAWIIGAHCGNSIKSRQKGNSRPELLFCCGSFHKSLQTEAQGLNKIRL